jgi:uncharacterized protein (TIGR00730 family)
MPASPRFSLCVFCGSRPGSDLQFRHDAKEVGAWIGRHGGRLVYGGGRNGLMGVMADAALGAGAEVLGIIPRSMVEREWAHVDCGELRVVDTMHDRKRLMAQHADAFLALPGGIGTFEEFFEVWTWRQLGFHDKPVALLNSNGYFNGLLQFLDDSVKAGFMTPAQTDLIQIGSDLSSLLPSLIQQAGFPDPSRLEQL